MEITITAAYDPLELDGTLVEKTDLNAEIQRLVQATEGMSAEELEAQVYKRFEFDLCGRCQRELLKNPLPPRAPDGTAPAEP